MRCWSLKYWTLLRSSWQQEYHSVDFLRPSHTHTNITNESWSCARKYKKRKQKVAKHLPQYHLRTFNHFRRYPKLGTSTTFSKSENQQRPSQSRNRWQDKTELTLTVWTMQWKSLSFIWMQHGNDPVVSYLRIGCRNPVEQTQPGLSAGAKPSQGSNQEMQSATR